MRIYTIITLLFLLLPAPSFAAGTSVILTPWNSPEGIERLERTPYKTDFYALVNYFEAQENKIYCGLASSAIVLNALRLSTPEIKKPQDQSLLPLAKRRYLPKGFDPIFERYTQNNLYNSQTKSEMEVLGKPVTINKKKVADYGLQLRQLATLLAIQGLDVTTRVVTDTLSEDVIRQELIQNMKTEGDYVLVNYSRKSLNQPGTGHISPLGAYDEPSDSFLVLDVNPNVATWTWVKTTDLIAAMRTFDTIENRGYVIVKEGKKHQQ